MSCANNKVADQLLHSHIVINVIALRYTESEGPIYLQISKVSRLTNSCSQASRFETDLVADPLRQVSPCCGSYAYYILQPLDLEFGLAFLTYDILILCLI